MTTRHDLQEGTVTRRGRRQLLRALTAAPAVLAPSPVPYEADPNIVLGTVLDDLVRRRDENGRQCEGFRAALVASYGEPCDSNSARWRADARDRHLRAAIDADLEISNRINDVMDQMSVTPATSIAGVGAKLRAVVADMLELRDDAYFGERFEQSVLLEAVQVINALSANPPRS